MHQFCENIALCERYSTADINVILIAFLTLYNLFSRCGTVYVGLTLSFIVSEIYRYIDRKWQILPATPIPPLGVTLLEFQ